MTELADIKTLRRLLADAAGDALYMAHRASSRRRLLGSPPVSRAATKSGTSDFRGTVSAVNKSCLKPLLPFVIDRCKV